MNYKLDENGVWQKYFNITDHLGSVRSIVKASNGAIVGEYDYKPFGEKMAVTGEDNPRLSFINKEKDIESSLGDFGVRKYEDGLGRFTTCDPLFEKYYGWSPYVYSANNPVNLYDNNGKWWENHHGLLVESAAKGNGLSRSQLRQLVRGTIQVDKRQKPEEQYLHCMLSAIDVKELGYAGHWRKQC